MSDGFYFTVVYKDVRPGPEAGEIGKNPKCVAMSWSHALHDRDDALDSAVKLKDSIAAMETHLRHLAQDYTRANIRIARLVEHVERLEKALSELSTIIDTMGDMPDGYIHPKPWRELYCEAALKRARAALEGKA